MKIEDWRAQIDVIDDELMILLNRRATLVAEIAAQKRKTGSAYRDVQRERQLLFRARQLNLGPLDAYAIERIFALVISESTRVAMEVLKCPPRGDRAN